MGNCLLARLLSPLLIPTLRPAHLAWVAATGAFSVAKRSYPTSEVKGRSWEDPMPKGRQPRGVTPRLRSGVAAGRSYATPQARGCSWEEQPRLQGAVAARAPEGLEELFHVQGQKGRR